MGWQILSFVFTEHLCEPQYQTSLSSPPPILSSVVAMSAKFRVHSKLYLLLLLLVSSFLSASSFNHPHIAARDSLRGRRVLETGIEDEVKVKKSTFSKKAKSDVVSEDKGKSKKDGVPEDAQIVKQKKGKGGAVSENEGGKIKKDKSYEDEQVVKSKVKNDDVSKEKSEKTKVDEKVKTKKVVPSEEMEKARTGEGEEKVKSKKKEEESGARPKKMMNTEETVLKTKNAAKTMLKTTNEESSSKNKTKTLKSKTAGESGSKNKGVKSQKKPGWMEDEDIDIVAQMRDFQSKFPQTIIPDMERISLASRKYATKANKEMIRGIKPIVGYKYASTIVSFVSFAFIVIPFLLVPLIFNRIKSYFSLQKILVFIQAYLAIYFSILCLSSLLTGIDPLKFFYATSTSTYLCVMVLQTLAYVLYLLMLLMYLVLVFSTGASLGSKLTGMGQAAVGFTVGLHFYMAVFHRVVLQQPPMTNWKTHVAYAACFMVLCGFAAAEKRKKTYLEEGGDEGKKN